MGDYVKRGSEQSSPSPQVPQSPQIDDELLAKKLAEQIGQQLKEAGVFDKMLMSGDKELQVDSVESQMDTPVMEKIAEAMAASQQDTAANFEGLGNTTETTKDNDDTQSTIDLLKNL